jgi:hypothetical protein
MTCPGGSRLFTAALGSGCPIVEPSTGTVQLRPRACARASRKTRPVEIPADVPYMGPAPAHPRPAWPRGGRGDRHIQHNPFGRSTDGHRADWPAVQIGGSARSRPPADHLTLRRSPSTGSRLRCPAGRSGRQPSTHVTRTALLDRCSEQEYEAVGTDGCPAAEVRDHCGFGDGPGGGVRESDVADLPVSHEVVQCGDGFFDRCVCWPELCSQYRSM